MKSLQLLILDEDGATFAITLRHLFVKELSDDINCSCRNFVTGSKEEIASKGNEFRTTGVFNREFGDVVIKACSNILRAPIMVIHQIIQCLVCCFLLKTPLSNDPMYVA